MGFGRLRGKSVISELGGREQKQKFYQTNDSNGLNMFTGGNVFLSYFFSFFSAGHLTCAYNHCPSNPNDVSSVPFFHLSSPAAVTTFRDVLTLFCCHSNFRVLLSPI